MKILKHLIVRICSLEAAPELLNLSGSHTNHLILIIELHDKLQHKKQWLLESLHEYNSSVKDKGFSNAIQNIRRAIFNDKPVKNKDIAVLNEQIEFPYLSDVKEYIAHFDTYTNRKSEFESLFYKEWNQKKVILRNYLSRDVIYNGILLSSFSLIEAFKNKKFNATAEGKKDRQFEMGLLKYVTRSTFKPSPFSSFTQVNYGEILPNVTTEGNGIYTSQRSSEIRSHVRINNIIFQRVRLYMTSIKDLYHFLDVQLNPSINYTVSNQYKFLINKNNFEYFQSIEKNSIVELIIDFLKKTGSLSFSALLNYCKEHVEADESELEKYIIRLVNVGLIEYNFKASGTDINWIDKLADNVKSIHVSGAQKSLMALLEDLKDYRLKYEQNFKDFRKREDIIISTARCLHENFMELYKIIKPEVTEVELQKLAFKKEIIFLEDTVSNKMVQINEDFLTKPLEKLDILVDHFARYSFFFNKEKKMFNFFNSAYSVGEISLLQFYEDYYRHLKQEKESEKEVVEKSPAVESKNGRKIVFEHLSSDCFQITHESANEFHFRIKDKALVNRKNLHSYSSSLFFQLADLNTDNPLVIVNGMSWGYGRMSSRFLYMFPKDFTDDIKDYNNKLNSEKIYSEVNDASFFNANLHPPLFKHECIIPGGHQNVEEKFQLKVNQLILRKDDTLKKLLLIDQVSGKEVLIHDSCFQVEKGRSPLFNLISVFSDKVTPSYYLILKEINIRQQIKLSEGIFLYPRIIFEDKLVLQRKFWFIESTLPTMNINESESNYFIRINLWRKQFDIPSQVFVTIKEGLKNENKLSQDEFKPQFIDFSNPIFLPLIIKIFKKSEIVKITEMLPSKEDSIAYDDSRQASEFLVQWYNGKNF